MVDTLESIAALANRDGQTADPPFTIEQCGDPTAILGRALCDKAAEVGTELRQTFTLLWTASGPRALEPCEDV